MSNMFEYEIKVNDNLTIKYIENDNITNTFINNNERNLMTKSAQVMTFKGLLNLIAFYSNTSNYTIDLEGIVLYRDIIQLNNNLYLQLEDSMEYYDEDYDDIIKDEDGSYNLNLYYSETNKDIEIASYHLNEKIIELFKEIQEFETNDYYKGKMIYNQNILTDSTSTFTNIR